MTEENRIDEEILKRSIFRIFGCRRGGAPTLLTFLIGCVLQYQRLITVTTFEILLETIAWCHVGQDETQVFVVRIDRLR